MSWLMYGRFRIVVAVLCLAAGACSSDDDDGDGAAADAGLLDAAPSCETSTGGGEAFELRLGLRSGANADYVELSDGDPATLVLGYQGLYMLLLESEAALPVESDTLCLECAVEVSPSTSGSFDGATQTATVAFTTTQAAEAFRGSFTLILGSGSERSKFDGAEVTVTQDCSGHGFSGSVERALRLMPE